MNNEQSPIIETYLWRTKDGIKLCFKIPVTRDEYWIEGVHDYLDYLLANGFQSTAPGVEPGSEVVPINWVCATPAKQRDGTDTVRIGFYMSDYRNNPHPFVAKYINTPEDIADFELATGLKIAELPVFPTTQFPERGATVKSDAGGSN